MMNRGESKGIVGNTFVVTGGLGFVGSSLCSELIRNGAREVRTLDLRRSSPSSDHLQRVGVNFIHGDVTNKNDVERALRGADCVFHLASYGVSGKEMLQVGRVDEVNINGTSNILDISLKFGVKRLVYMSTYNVVFKGKEIVNGNEELDHLPIDIPHFDPYARSKSVAEQLVLKSNGRLSMKDGIRLYTCAVRPAIIYGPGGERQLAKLVSLAMLGLLTFRIGGADVKTDWVYMDNAVNALMLANIGLLDPLPGISEANPVAAGQSYFISDGSPVNTFEFIGPLLSGLDRSLPNWRLNVHHALLLGRTLESIFRTVLNPWLNSSWLPEPPILPAQVYNVGVTHYFSNLKAEKELGYVPRVRPEEGMRSTISYWQKRKNKMLEGPSIYAWLFCIIGLPSIFAAAWLPYVGPMKLIREISLFFFRSMRNIRMIFYIVVTAHVGEAIFAWFLARRVDPGNTTAWFFQTLLLATFSLRFLWKRARNKSLRL